MAAQIMAGGRISAAGIIVIPGEGITEMPEEEITVPGEAGITAIPGEGITEILAATIIAAVITGLVDLRNGIDAFNYNFFRALVIDRCFFMPVIGSTIIFTKSLFIS